MIVFMTVASSQQVALTAHVVMTVHTSRGAVEITCTRKKV